MKISDYVKQTKESLPDELADQLLQNGSIWTNAACYGYCIKALENAGYSKKETDRIIHSLHSAFEEYMVEEAEDIWMNH